MSIYSSNFTLASIEEVGMEDILIDVNGEKIEVKINDENREFIMEQVQENSFFVPFNLDTNEVLIDIDSDTVKEMYSEFELEEMQDTDQTPSEYQ